MSDVCEHGSLRRQCPHCELNDLDKRILALEAALRPVAALNLGPNGYCSSPLTKLVEQARALLHDSTDTERKL